MSATIPVPEQKLRIERQEFRIGDRTWIYDVDLITIEQAITSDEALSFKLELMQRELESFTQAVESGTLAWFWECAGALLRELVAGQPVAHSPMQWRNAATFVRELPYAEIARLRSCMDDFFTSTGRGAEISYVFNPASKKRSSAMLFGLLTKGLKERLS